MFWFRQGLCILPVCLVVLHDVDVLLPYISDTANSPPESCFFGLMTFISACTCIATIYAMYKYIAKLGEDKGVAFCNRAALGLGLLSCFGMCVVATFQESAVEDVHLTGALLFFVCGALYISMETYISYCLFPYGSSLLVCRIRLILSVISGVVFLPSILSLQLDPRLAKASAGCEWIVAFSFVSFFLTYIHDFKVSY
uniref:DNA-damage regulated autophagy modulator 1 n=1 Tax=Neogobius melanostomus TaxID=47308 RepID=A0A8C6WV49_9GOBI